MTSTAATRIRNVLFDLDGTLVDSLPGIESALRRALQDTQLDGVTAGLRGLIGVPLRSYLRQVARQASEAQLDALASQFRVYYDRDGWQQTAAQRGARETLRDLTLRGKRIFVVTNKPLEATTRILEMLGMRNLVEDVLARDSRTPQFDSKAEMIEELLARYGLLRGESLLVGDTKDDCEAGKVTGIPVAIMRHGYGADTSGRCYPGCRILPDFAALAAAIGESESVDR